MATVTEDMVGRRVRITRSECIEGPADCGSCARAVGQEGVVSRSYADRKGVRLIVGDYGFVREVELLDEPAAPPSFQPGQRVRVTGDGSIAHGWTAGQEVTLISQRRTGSSWLATVNAWRVGETVPDHTYGGGTPVRYIPERDFEAIAAAPETFTVQGRTWTVGERVSEFGREAVVISPSDPAYNEQFGHPVDTSVYVPVRYHVGGRLNGINPLNLARLAPAPTTTATATATTEENTMTTAFTPEQEEKLREVIGRHATRHGACSVAAEALRELGVSQPQQTRSVTVTISLQIPLANSSGQVQLPDASQVPADYLAKAIGTAQLNTLADQMLVDGGRNGYRVYRRQGDATATVTSVA